MQQAPKQAPIRTKLVVASIVVAVLVVLSGAYLCSLEVLSQALFSAEGAEASQAASVSEQLSLVGMHVPAFSLVVLLVAPPLLYRYLHLPQKRDAPLVIVSLFMAFSIVGTAAVVGAGSVRILFATGVCGLFTVISIASFAVLAFALMVGALAAVESFRNQRGGPTPPGTTPLNTQGTAPGEGDAGESSRKQSESEEPPSRLFVASRVKWLLIPAAVIFAGWLPYAIIFFPGSVCYDMAWELLQASHLFEYDAHHPLFVTHLYGFIYAVGEMVGGPNGGVLAWTLFQLIIMAAACGFEVYLMANLRAPRWVLVITVAFFALLPAFGTSVQWSMKDILFSALFVVYLSLMVVVFVRPHDALRSKAFVVIFVVVCIILGLSRNNASFALVASLPFLLCVVGHQWRKMLAITIIVVVAVPLLTASMAAVSNAARGNVGDMLSMPIQQIGRVVAFEDDLTDEERAVVEGTLRLESAEIADAYNEQLSDPLKDAFDNDRSVLELLGVWIALGLRHPVTYLDAWIAMTYGFTCVQDVSTLESMDVVYMQQGDTVFGYSYAFLTSFRAEAERMIDAIKTLPPLSYLRQPGLYTWLLLIAAAFALSLREPKRLIILLPAFALLITMVLGPVNGSLRYALPVLFTMPLSLWFIVSGRGESMRPESSVVPSS